VYKFKNVTKALIFSAFLFNSNSESDFNFLKIGYEMKFIEEKLERSFSELLGQEGFWQQMAH
jgi:hypothetical protein